jgi:hypothetical protein
MEQWSHLLVTIRQDVIGAYQALGHEIAQEVSSVQQQLDNLLRIIPSAPNLSLGTAVPPHGSNSSSGSGTSVPSPNKPPVTQPRIMPEAAASMTIEVTHQTTFGDSPIYINGTVDGWIGPLSKHPLTVTVSATDDSGDQTNATVTGPDNDGNWSATFDYLPEGVYSITVQAQQGGQTVSLTYNINVLAG